MPTETQLENKSIPKVQMWAAYNHMPGGQILAIHFEDTVRARKIGDHVQNLLFTAKEQIEAFEKGDQVCVNIKGQITKHKILTYNGPDLKYNPKAGNTVIAWAIAQGMQPVQSKNDKEPKGFERDKRLDAVEGQVQEIKASISSLADSVKAMAEALTPKK